jgi:SAM-dependent methyltransferase
LMEAKRVLKPDGLAFIATPYLSPIRRIIYHPIRELAMFMARCIGKKTYFWEYRFVEDELVNYIREAGFEIIEIAVDDYARETKQRHIGLYVDWFFLRKKGGEIWELNFFGKAVLAFLRVFPERWYCSGIVVVAKPLKISTGGNV